MWSPGLEGSVTVPEWLLSAYEACGVPEFVAFARQQRETPAHPVVPEPSPPTAGTSVRVEPQVSTAQVDELYVWGEDTIGEGRVVTLTSRAGETQAVSPPWPFAVMVDGVPGYLEYAVTYLIPPLPGEDLEAATESCREAILATLPATSVPTDVRLERFDGWQLIAICTVDLDVFPDLPALQDLTRVFTVNCTTSGLLHVLLRALGEQGGVLPREDSAVGVTSGLLDTPLQELSGDDLVALANPVRDSEALDELPEEPLPDFPADDLAALAELLKPCYELADLSSDPRTRAYLSLLDAFSGLAAQLPVEAHLSANALRAMTTLRLVFRSETLTYPPDMWSESPQALALCDVLRDVLGDGRRFDRGYLGEPMKVMFHSAFEGQSEFEVRFPGARRPGEAGWPLLARRVLAACHLGNVVERFAAVLDGAQAPMEDDGAESLSPAVIAQAGLTVLPEDRQDDGSFLAVSWRAGGQERTQGLLWLEPDDTRPYPLLIVKTAFDAPGGHDTALLRAVTVDHFMQMTLPAEEAATADHHWRIMRTLAPTLFREVDDDENQYATIQVFPVLSDFSAPYLRFATATAFGQFQDILQRVGYDLTSDGPPPALGAGDRSWLTADDLLELVGPQWTWDVSRDNEIQCRVRFADGAADLGAISFYLRFSAVEDDNPPALYLRAHTNGGMARTRLGQAVGHHLGTLEPQCVGRVFPVSVDRDGDLTVRQVIPCLERPTPEVVQALVGIAERSLVVAQHQIVQGSS